jgi:alkanesulfonate monooxygenase SsuD/methylene tetrahydromethanopterin reductase-like flavin-dependent oxidoreductase (luciferase family)
MMIGCSVPSSGPLTDPDSLTAIATEAEALGYDYVTVSDHIVIPADIDSRYPYSESGEFPAGTQVDRHEQLMECMFIAALTKKLRIVTSVMVVPHRPAMLTAKLVATLDVLC